MAVPKKKQSRARTHKRRSAWLGKFKAPTLVKCPKCGAAKRPHVVCRTCGTYKGEKVLEVKHHVTRQERRAAAKAAAAKAAAAKERKQKAAQKDTATAKKLDK